MNKNNDIILLIFNCQKYRYKAMKQKQTWLKNFELFPYFHVIGDNELKEDYLFEYEDKILYVKTPDDYNSLPKKVIAAYSAVNKEFTFKYIFKTDDDQHLVNNHFFSTIKHLLNPQIHYGGYIVNVNKPYLSQYHKIHPELPEYLPILQTSYCSGRFYLLSRQAVQNLIYKKEFICKEYLEDYAIGYYLDPIFKTSIFNIETNKYFTDII